MTINRHFLPTLCAMVLLADVAPAPGCSSRTRNQAASASAEVTDHPTMQPRPRSDQASHAMASELLSRLTLEIRGASNLIRFERIAAAPFSHR